jgi:hypothetical protein
MTGSTHHPIRQARADVVRVPVTARRRTEEDDDLHISSDSDSELFHEFANDSSQTMHETPGGGDEPNSLSVLHSDLASLDAEIAVLQRGIVEATKRQSGGSPPQ